MTRLAILLALAGIAGGCTGTIERDTHGKDHGSNATDPPGPDEPGDPDMTPTPGTGGKPGPMMDPTTPPAPPSAQVLCEEASRNAVGRRALRRLTNAELETTIRSVFGLDAKQWAGLNVPPDSGSLDG